MNIGNRGIFFLLETPYKALTVSSNLNPQKTCACSVARDGSDQISTYAHYYMDRYLFYPSEPYFGKGVRVLKDTEESLNMGSQGVFPFKLLSASENPHEILHFMVFFKVETRAIAVFPASIFKKATLSFSFIKSTTEFESFSLCFSTPILQLYPGRTEELPLRGNSDLSREEGIFSSPWILGNIGDNVVFKEMFFILSAIIGSICYCIRDRLSQWIYNFSGIRGKGFEDSFIMSGGRGNLQTDWQREFSIGNFKMEFIAKEGEVFGFITPVGISIRRHSLDVRGVNGEGEFFLLDKADGLSNKIHEDFLEEHNTDTFSEVVESGMGGGISVGEASEVGESGIESEFMSEVSFRGSFTEVDKEESFKEALGIKALASSSFISIFEKGIYKGEVNRVKEDFKGVIRGDESFYFKVNEGVLFGISHLPTSFLWN